jgi:hypothetical protein
MTVSRDRRVLGWIYADDNAHTVDDESFSEAHDSNFVNTDEGAYEYCVTLFVC